MKAVLTMMMILTVSCGEMKELETRVFDSEKAESSIHQFAGIDAKLQPMVDQLGCEVPSTLTVGFGDLEGYVLGRCVAFNDGTAEIIVDKTSWSDLTVAQREVVILHELGHCVLGLEHSEDKNAIMRSRNFTYNEASAFAKDKAHYIDEMKAYSSCSSK